MTQLEVLTNPRNFLPYWFQKKKLTVQGNLILDTNDRPFEMSIVFGSMWLDYREEVKAYNAEADDEVRGFPEKDLVKAIEEFLEVKRQEALAIVKESIRYAGASDEELKLFVTAVTGKCDEVELAVYKHLLWQVKRKMFGKKVHDHMMIVLKGKQGGGKTEAVKALFRFIKPWFKCASLKEATDDRWRHFYKNTFVLFSDELQYADRTDIDALKNIISAEEMESRKLGHNIYDNLRQNATFIGASNKHLFELFRDPTGMRRFYESKTLDKMDWAAINKLDTQKIWQSINENEESPYIAPFKTQLFALQNELVIPDPDEEFLETFRLLDESSKGTRDKFASNEILYSVYEMYCEKNGERRKTSIQFHKKIKALGMKAFETRNGQAGTRGYWVTEKVQKLMERYKSGLPYHNVIKEVFGDFTTPENNESASKGHC